MTTGIPEMHKFHVSTVLLGSANTLYQLMSWEFFVPVMINIQLEFSITVHETFTTPIFLPPHISVVYIESKVHNIHSTF